MNVLLSSLFNATTQKKQLLHNVQLSIVTVVKHMPAQLQSTIESIKHQKTAEVEYIVVNGGNDAQTNTILSQYKAHIDVVISEQDNGIYDAMNKGIAHAKGTWVWFLNAGDVLYNNVIEQLRPYLLDSASGVLYGKYNESYQGHIVQKTPLPITHIRYRMISSHQSTLVRKSLIAQDKFIDSFIVCADYDMLCRLFSHGIVFTEIPLCMSIVNGEGFSLYRNKDAKKERRQIAKKYFPGIFTQLRVDLYHTQTAIKWALRKILPSCLARALRSLLHMRFVKNHHHQAPPQ